MKYQVYDPKPYGNEYASRMFFQPMRQYARDRSIQMEEISSLDHAKGSNVVILTDHLSEERILKLKNNGCRISAFNVTDSSYFSNAIRYAPSIGLIDCIFMVSGLAWTNEGKDFVVEPDFTITQIDSPFLPDNEWAIYHRLMVEKKLCSLPYVSWDAIPDIPWTPWNERSKKVLIRGGGHSRRIILAMFLMNLARLDCNSGMVLFPYFADDMNPQFRFCDECRRNYKAMARAATYFPGHRVDGCQSPSFVGDGKWDMSNLGHWNNRCPRSFYWMAEQFNKKHGGVDMKEMETLLNAKWITDRQHQEMLARIAFTSDLKWIHSIYMPQRFWQGAAAGSINFLPDRTANQTSFPDLMPGEDYITFPETFLALDQYLEISEEKYNHVSRKAKAKYDHWIKPGPYPINTNLLNFIFRVSQYDGWYAAKLSIEADEADRTDPGWASRPP